MVEERDAIKARAACATVGESPEPSPRTGGALPADDLRNYGPVSPSADGSERTAASGRQRADSSSSAAAQQQLVLLLRRLIIRLSA